MTSHAEVTLWGERAGEVRLRDGDAAAAFAYDRAFTAGKLEVAPLTMPLASGGASFPDLDRDTFYGLPGLLADSLPDRFGQTLIGVWLAAQGHDPAGFDAVWRLRFVGRRAVGALELVPVESADLERNEELDVGALVAFMSDLLSDRDRVVARLALGERSEELHALLRIGTSAGGARAKGVIAWNPDTGAVRSGEPDVAAGFEPWLIKFDGVARNRDRDDPDPTGVGALEYAYSTMAVAAGIEMTACALLVEDGRRHFMTRRFDRDDGGDRRHMQSLAAIAHMDYNLAGTYSYEQLIDVLRRLGGLDAGAAEQLFRRMTFNVVARNHDDHVKNFAFLMDRSGRWRLSPAYDLTFAYRPGSHWIGRHQISLNGKRDEFTRADLRAVGGHAGLDAARTDAMFTEVRDVVASWREHAAAAGVAEEHADRIEPALRLELPAS